MNLRSTAQLVAMLPVLAMSNANAQTPTRSAADVITVVGCVERESDYRVQVGEGKGGVVGTGVGVANEVILRYVRPASKQTLEPIGKNPPRSQEEIYSVTGELEGEMAKAIGREVAAS